MTLKIIAVGALKQKPARALADDYLGRLRRYTRVEEIELRAAGAAKETAAFRKAYKGCNVVALDIPGEALSSAALAKRLSRLMSRGKGDVALLIGGADGLPKPVLDDAIERWSLSALTLPHRLARVLLAEQLYRAMTILRNEPYHH